MLRFNLDQGLTSKKFASGGLLRWGRAYLIVYNYIFYFQEVLFVIINFLYTRPCDSRARTRALMVEFLSIADSLSYGHVSDRQHQMKTKVCGIDWNGSDVFYFSLV